MDHEIIVIGAGLSGLTCALQLQRQGLDVAVVERSQRAGGRVRTDEMDGFLLDRGFQVLLTAYPNTSSLLDLEALDLRPFLSGAIVRRGGRFHRMTDPLRDPAGLLSTLRSTIGSFSDKFKMLSLRQSVTGMSYEELWEQPEITTLQALRERYEFSDDMIDGFFRPFIGGVTLDSSLQTSSRFFEFVMRMFSQGDAAVPARGMQAIPDQLAASLDRGTIRFETEVERIEPGKGVELGSGDSLKCEIIVVATEAPQAWNLVAPDRSAASVGVTSLYFSSEKAPIDEPILILNGERGVVNNLAVMSLVSERYAPAGAELISVTLLDDLHADLDQAETAARYELSSWFGPEVDSWKTIDRQNIRYALPRQTPPSLEPPQRDVQLRPGLFVCGDHRDTASIEGAVTSGLRTASEILHAKQIGDPDDWLLPGRSHDP
jgi:phytoene dehydrogenase-like protein